MDKLLKKASAILCTLIVIFGAIGITTKPADAWGVSTLSKNAYVEIKNPTKYTATITIDGTSIKVPAGKYGSKTINLNGNKTKKISYSFTNGGPYRGSKTVYGSGTIQKGTNYSLKPRTGTVSGTGWGLGYLKNVVYVKGF